MSNSKNDQYIQSFEKYDDVVIAHLYGHLHTDTFRLTKNNGPMFLSPSLNTFDRNPGLARRFTYNRTNV